jgi:predicted transcriptional regulator
MPEDALIQLTADIVSAHVSNNAVASADLPGLIRTVFTALSQTSAQAAPEPAKAEPAVPVRSSVKPDYIVCLEDGKKLKMLKRYLRTNYNMSPEDYRAKWNLPRDYPMVAPNYAETRRTLAHAIGLGRTRGAAAAEQDAPPVTKPDARKRLGIAGAKRAAQQHLGTDSEPQSEG